jgi:hypothetical protein
MTVTLACTHRPVRRYSIPEWIALVCVRRCHHPRASQYRRRRYLRQKPTVMTRRAMSNTAATQTFIRCVCTDGAEEEDSAQPCVSLRSLTCCVALVFGTARICVCGHVQRVGERSCTEPARRVIVAAFTTSYDGSFAVGRRREQSAPLRRGLGEPGTINRTRNSVSLVPAMGQSQRLNRGQRS